MALTYERPFVAQLEKRLLAEQPLIQVLIGPRQIGKTTGIRQLLARSPFNNHYANADDLLVTDRLRTQAFLARQPSIQQCSLNGFPNPAEVLI